MHPARVIPVVFNDEPDGMTRTPWTGEFDVASCVYSPTWAGCDRVDLDHGHNSM